MGKAFGAIMRFLFATILIGVLAYNTYEIGRLRAEVAALQAGHAEEANVAQRRQVAAGAMEQIAEAQSHTEKASQYLSEKRFADATREMRAASDAAQRASGDAQTESRGAVADMQQSLAKVSAQTAALWKQAESVAASAKAALPKQNAAAAGGNQPTSHDSDSGNQ